MKTRHKRNLELALICMIALFILFLACGNGPGPSPCGSVTLTCPDIEPRELCNDCYLVSQHTEGNKLYFKFFNCAANKTVQSSVSADCSIRGR